MDIAEDNDLMLKIGHKLKEIRLKKNLIQTDVAKGAGIEVNHYAKIERGKVKLKVETLAKIVKSLKIKSSAILPF